MSSLTIHSNNRDGKNQPRQSLPVSISPVNNMLPTTTKKPETMLEIRDVSVSVFNRILNLNLMFKVSNLLLENEDETDGGEALTVYLMSEIIR